MSEAPRRRDHLADVQAWSGNRGERRRFAVALALAGAAHLMLLVRFDLSTPVPAMIAEPSIVSLDLSRNAPSPSPTISSPVKPVAQPALAPPSQTIPDPKPAPAEAPPAPVAPAAPAAEPDPPAANTPPLGPVNPLAEPASFSAAPVQRVAMPRADSPGASLPNCDLTGALQTALQDNLLVRDALTRIPRRSRSVANAVQLWDGQWGEANTLGGEAIAGPIRQAITQTIEAAPLACHDQPVAGPRLFIILDPRGATVVALGSGLWKWSDLLGAPSPEPPQWASR